MLSSCVLTLFCGILTVYSKYKGFDPIIFALSFQWLLNLGSRVNVAVTVGGEFEQKLACAQKCFKLLDIP